MIASGVSPASATIEAIRPVELVFGKLNRGKIDRDRNARAAVAPGARLPAGHAEHVLADRPMRPHSSAIGMNSHGRDDSARRMLPARQRLGADQLVAVRAHLRLVGEEELVVVDRVAEVGFQLARDTAASVISAL